MGPITRPVSLSSMISSSLARAISKVSCWRSRSVKKVNPPDTSTVLKPAACAPVNNSLAPKESKSLSSNTCCKAVASKPFNSATRCVKLSRKSNSPRMADSVIAATSFFKPCMSAISSMHSMVISVESISITKSLKSESFLSSCMKL